MKKQIWSGIAKNGALLDRRYSNKVPEVVDKGTSLSVALVGLCLPFGRAVLGQRKLNLCDLYTLHSLTRTERRPVQSS